MHEKPAAGSHWEVFIETSDDPQNVDAQDLLKIAQVRMPFGRYQGVALIDLPEPYVVWFHQQGYPKGDLGRLLGLLYEIKLNGLEYLFEPLREFQKFS